MLHNLEAFHPPHVLPLQSPVGFLKRGLTFIRNPLEGFEAKIYQEGLTQHRSLFVRMHVLTDPDGISEVLVKRVQDFHKSKLNQRIIEPVTRDGLITTHDEQWRCQRRAIAPIFRHRHMEVLSHHAVDAIDAFMNSPAIQNRQTIDLKTAMSDLTFDVLARALLGNPQGLEARRLREACDIAIATAGTLRVDDFLPLPNWFPRILTPKAYRATALLRRAASKLLEERATQDHADDLVGLLSHSGHKADRPLTRREQVDNLIGFFIAGHESTAVALTWALYLIAKHPETQRRIREEVCALGRPREEQITYQDIERLPFTKAVLNETMRLYPSFPIIGREAIRGTEIMGKKIKKGTTVVIPIYAMHRSPKYWPNPNQFSPDRFLREPNLTKRNPKFIPFGAGPRICIGASFATMEAVLVIANLLKSVKVSVESSNAVKPILSVSLRPDCKIWLKVTKLPIADVRNTNSLVNNTQYSKTSSGTNYLLLNANNLD